MGLLCAEQDVGNLKTSTSGNYGTPVRRPRRRKSQKVDFQEFWDSCAQNKTSEISKNALPGILGFLCAERNVRNLKECTFRNYETPGSRIQDPGSRIRDPGSWIEDPGSRILDQESVVQDPGSTILDQDPGSRILDQGHLECHTFLAKSMKKWHSKCFDWF